jgi:hypothetical protein
MYRYELNGGTLITESGIHNDSARTYLGSGWYYAWATFTTQATTNNMTCYSFTYNPSNFNDKLSVAKVAILQGNYSGLHPRFWPDTNTTRANIESIIDSSNNGRTTEINLASTATFNTDYNAVTLDGNAQYIYVHGGNYWNAWSPNGVNGNSAMSIELVFSSSDTSGYIVSRPWNGSGQYNYLMGDGFFNLWINNSTASLGYSSICTGEITHMIWWMSPTQYGVYKNGEVLVGATNHGLSGSGGSAGTNDFGTLFGSLYPYGSGWGGNTGLSINGKFYLARIYNRVLSANEVAQNFNSIKNRYLGENKSVPADSGLALRTIRPELPSGYYWIKNSKMPNALRMYVDMSQEGGGYDFYPIQGNGISIGSVNGIHSGTALGLDLVYPRSKAHWTAMSNFVRNVLGSTGNEYFTTVYAVYRETTGSNGSRNGNYTNDIMRNPTSYGSGAPDWRVPDNGRWWLRDTIFSEPNGDYTAYNFLGGYTFPNPYTGQDLGFNDLFAQSYATGSYYLLSTNAKP